MAKRLRRQKRYLTSVVALCLMVSFSISCSSEDESETATSWWLIEDADFDLDSATLLGDKKMLSPSKSYSFFLKDKAISCNVGNVITIGFVLLVRNLECTDLVSNTLWKTSVSCYLEEEEFHEKREFLRFRDVTTGEDYSPMIACLTKPTDSLMKGVGDK